MDNQNINNQNDEIQITEIPKETMQALLEELGIADLPEEQRNELMAKMTEAIIKRILLEVLEKMTEADKTVYEKMIDRDASPEEMDAFIREKIPDYDKIAEKAVKELKEEMQKEI
jgi:hypothetical protein